MKIGEKLQTQCLHFHAFKKALPCKINVLHKQPCKSSLVKSISLVKSMYVMHKQSRKISLVKSTSLVKSMYVLHKQPCKISLVKTAL
jgi:hypothetical protein